MCTSGRRAGRARLRRWLCTNHVRKGVRVRACVPLTWSRARICVSIYLSVRMHVRVWSHLASVASSSSGQISGLWRRCRPGSRCTAPASYRGSFAAGERSVGGRVAPSPVAFAGSNRWRWPLPCLRRNSRRKNSRVSVRVSRLFNCVHRRGRSADGTRHKPSSVRFTGYNDPILQPPRSKVQNTLAASRYSMFSVIIPPLAMYLKRRGLPVRHVPPVCLSGG